MMRFDFREDFGTVVFERPQTVFEARSPAEVVPALRAAEEARRRGYWIAGYVAYEASSGIDPTLVTHPLQRFPLVWFGAFARPASALDAAAGSYQVGRWTPRISEVQYRAAIVEIRERIRDGLTYQVNYTMRFDASFAGDPRRWYDDLRQAQGGNFSAYLDTGEFVILSASPELFFRVRGRTVQTRPMKGTARRGYFDRDDRALCDQLSQSEKDRAENVMIVDLMRNDLGKIAEMGSVRADPVFQIERYPTVWQMTSTVNAKLLPGETWLDVLMALFPSGSITGAPKVRTMQVIRALEPDPRGVYCGTVGLVSPGGDAVFNVAIRTVTIDRARQRALFGSGGGITWDSRADREYQEMWAKAQFLDSARRPCALLETMAWADGQWALKAYHLQRLHHAAEYFGWPWHEQAVNAALEQAVSGRRGRWRVRLQYGPAGVAECQALPLEPNPRGVQPVAWASAPMPARDAWTDHKTTWRDRYAARHPSSSRFYDHLLYNARGEVTEFTRGNVVVRLDGQLWTPPVSCGLLPGTFRQWLLDQRAIFERTMTVDEVGRAQELWFINSVRGWVPVRLVAGEANWRG
jgi:para-aminobenzoate synthetase/4-amino-4-deoxychorismate lyase